MIPSFYYKRIIPWVLFLLCSCATPPKQKEAAPKISSGWYGEKLPPGIQRRTKVNRGEPPLRNIRGEVVQDPSQAKEYIRIKDGAVMVYIPEGTFTMGNSRWDGTALKSEKPEILVHLSSYYIDKYEITQSQFQRFVKATGYKTLAEKEGFSYQWNGREWQKISGISWKNPFPKGIAEEIDFSHHPVVHVSWVDCVEYAKWAGGKLPSEAQWERAARGEDKRKYPWGNEWPQGTYFANATFHRSWEYIELDGYPYTAPVGSFVTGVSPYGCMDMSGNVWEWCQDDWETLWYQRLFRESRGQQRVYENLVNQGVGKYKSIRGGGWTPTPRDFRVTSRGRNHPHYRAGDLGFRLVVPGIE